MDGKTLNSIDKQIIGDLYLSRGGAKFVEDLVTGYGSRFGGSQQERAAAEFIRSQLEGFGLDKVWTERFDCMGWTRKETKLTVISPVEMAMECIALPFCPPEVVEAPLVFLGDGDPQTYADNRDRHGHHRYPALLSSQHAPRRKAGPSFGGGSCRFHLDAGRARRAARNRFRSVQPGL
jgi:hypothetical protein